jgi:hypothetical protein
MDIMQRIIL